MSELATELHVAELPPEPKLQPDPVLLSDTEAFIKRFVELPSDAHPLVLATWTIHTWAFEAAFVTPYLYVSSSVPGAGKTRTGDVLGVLVRNADSGTDSPVHVLGQEIAANRPTLFFDEFDTVYAGRANNPLKRVLNIGYKRGAVIKRQRANQVESWPVFCPKVLIGIRNNHLPQSLLSRCIPIEMNQRTKELERFNEFHVLRDPSRTELVDRMAYFAEQFSVDVANQRPEPLKALNDRQNEIVEPLLAIATVLGREDDLREALQSIFRSEAGGRPSREQVLLTRIRAAFELQALRGLGPRDMIFTEDLINALGPYTPRLLGILLAEMGFVRTQAETIRIDTQVRKGYYRSDFEPLFARFLDKGPLRVIEGGGEETEEESP